MKKTILLAALLVGLTSSAHAAFTFTESAGSSLGSTPFKTSTNVTLIADSTTTTYDVASKHLQGTIIYLSDESAATISEYSTAETNKGKTLTSSAGAAS